MKNKWLDKIEKEVEDNAEEFDFPDGACEAIEIASTQASILFRTLGWTWWGNDRPPTFNEINAAFYRLMQSCIQENLECVRSGRLCCYVNNWDSDTKEYIFCIDCSSVIVENPVKT
jgi:hypothetical protein